jgi:Leucine-rich repeat (LRR) protein
MLLLDREYDATELRRATDLDLRNVSDKNWENVLTISLASRLSLYHVTTAHLTGIEALLSVESLAITWAPKINDLNPVFRMSQLKELDLSDFKQLRSIAGIQRLTKLTSLRLSGNLGSMSPKLQLESIAPVAQIPSLTHFSLQNATIADNDITTLAGCKSLVDLELSNQFDRAQFAYLAKHLNHQLSRPIEAHRETSLMCQHCGANTRMVTGRRMPFLCSTCDVTRLSKAETQFAALVDAAA